MSTKNDAIREHVSKTYAEALERAQGSGGGCCGGAVEPAGVAAKSAGYGAELATHAEAGRTSFGCGNPLALAEVRPGETVLDLGSGGGLDLLIAAERVGPSGHVIGVDMTEAMVEAARAHAARAGYANVEVRQGLIETLPVDDASVDWVISNCVVNLSPEKERVFAEIARVLRPGGRISISDLVAEDLPPVVLESAAARASCIAGAIPEREYVAGLEAAGLEEVRVTERLVYTREQLAGMTDCCSGAERTGPSALETALEGAAGKVASVRFTGRRGG